MLYNSRHLDELVIVMKYAIPHQAHHGRFDVRSGIEPATFVVTGN